MSDSLTFGFLVHSFEAGKGLEEVRVRLVSCWNSGTVLFVDKGLNRGLELDHVLRRVRALFRAFLVAEGRVQLFRGIWLGRTELSLFRRFLSDVLWLGQSCTGRVCRVSRWGFSWRFDFHLLISVQFSLRQHDRNLHGEHLGHR